MKKDEKENELKGTCRRIACIECALCKAVNFEEKRSARQEIKTQIKALYDAEVQFYYFYFFPAVNRV